VAATREAHVVALPHCSSTSARLPSLVSRKLRGGRSSPRFPSTGPGTVTPTVDSWLDIIGVWLLVDAFFLTAWLAYVKYCRDRSGTWLLADEVDHDPADSCEPRHLTHRG
jgi:hypothetical protein